MPQSTAEANHLMEEHHGFNSSNGDPEEWIPTADEDEDENNYCEDCGNLLVDNELNSLCPPCCADRLAHPEWHCSVVTDRSSGVSV
jgi:hypothetical protein